MLMKIYQVVQREFYISNGCDYLNACSPFGKGLGYKSIKTAEMIANNLYNEYKELNNNGFCSGNGVNFTAQVATPTMRIVITIEEILIK